MERVYESDYEMGVVSQYFENLILHSMSAKLMTTDAQLKLESMGARVKCRVDRFKVQFSYGLPADEQNIEEMLTLCREDHQTRINSPAMIPRQPADLIPYFK